MMWLRSLLDNITLKCKQTAMKHSTLVIQHGYVFFNLASQRNVHIILCDSLSC